MMYEPYGLFIAGSWVGASDGAEKEVMDPATEEPIGTIPMATEQALDRSLVAVEEGFAAWRRVSPWDRGAVLSRTAELIRERVDSIALLMSRETGKPLAEGGPS
jgi:succinate-semialdehyde dehydrogenase/glutarate-semialdehyde dehydrogenase